MKQTLTFSTFVDAFRAMGRFDAQDGKGGNFTSEGLRVLFGCIESYEEDTGTEIELDVIALCREYSEETPADIAANYSIDLSPEALEDCAGDEEEQKLRAVLAYLGDRTSVCGVTDSGRIVYAQF